MDPFYAPLAPQPYCWQMVCHTGMRDAAASADQNNERCTITAQQSLQITTTEFSTESCCDYLTIRGTRYKGSVRPSNGLVLSAGETMYWYTDGSIVGSGFGLCAYPTDGSVPTSNPAPAPPVFTGNSPPPPSPSPPPPTPFVSPPPPSPSPPPPGLASQFWTSATSMVVYFPTFFWLLFVVMMVVVSKRAKRQQVSRAK